MKIQFKTRNDKQLLAVEAWLDNSVEELLYGGSKGGGKIVADDGFVLTPFGFKKGVDLEVGNLITNPDGSIQKIIQIKPRETLQLARVHFADKTYTEVAPGHLWTAWKSTKTRKINNVRTSGINSAEVVETNTIKEWLEKGYKPQIPVTNDVPFNIAIAEKNRISPYLLGILLGDGCITTRKSIGVSSSQEDIPHYISKIGSEYITVHKKGFNFIGERKVALVKKLEDYNLLGTYSHTKFIPKRYKYYSIGDRYELVRGLMDTDGYMPRDKNSCNYYTVSKQLAEDIAFVLRSLGAVVSTSKKIGKYKKDGKVIECRECYILSIKHREPSKLFSLKRKQFNTIKREIGRAIVKVEYDKEITGRCITVSNPNGLYITNDFIVTHNSYLGASLIFGDALIYPETHYFIARKELNDLRKYTIPTVHEVFKNFGLDIDEYAKYNGQDNYFLLHNKSKVFLIACKEEPSDPLFERFGSMQMTRGWIEEGGEIAEAAKSNLWLSIGRWKNGEYNLKKKLLITANPKKGWMKDEFVEPFTRNELQDSKRYIQALPTDNPYLPTDYLESLRNEKDPIRRQRLWEGNWNYDDDQNSLIQSDSLTDCFTNTIDKDGKKYIIADIARLGRDRTVVSVWDGLELVKIFKYTKQGIDVSTQAIKDLAAQYRVPFSNILVDEDGIGGGVVDNLQGIKGFTANSSPIPTASQIRERSKKIEHFLVPKTTFSNLKSQCGWKLSELINEHKISFKVDDRKDIINELSSMLRDKSIDGDGKKSLVKKEDVKKEIGNSPDIGDVILMRVYFELIKDSNMYYSDNTKEIQSQNLRFNRNEKINLNDTR